MRAENTATTQYESRLHRSIIGVMRLLLPLFLMAIVVVVILGMMLAANRKSVEKRKLDDPREILKRRYAAGEIGEDEYLRRMSGLDQNW